MRKLRLKELNRVSPNEFKALRKTPIVIVLDNIRSASNVGSVFRTADAFALEKICLCGITAKPPHREILKTAIGATQSMDWSDYENTLLAVNELRNQGYKIIAIEQAEGSQSLEDFSFNADEKLALVFGNEVNGVGDDVMQIVDTALEVPQFGTKHSLNISVCMGIVTWELFRQWKYC